ncbi:MAG: ABC transporter ATP-binding protein, partial [Caldilineaceae bacterium]|nr:ABC transporter ATP-binding protein [Caldilineaceae bacterium]
LYAHRGQAEILTMLTIDHLTAGYGKLTILHDISLAVTPGQFVAVLGPNGSGKSTLLKSIFGLADVGSGAIRLGNRALHGLPTEQVCRHGIAYVPQRQNVFASLSVRENLLLAVRQKEKAEADNALARAYALFPILGQRQAQRARSLSGGERQMLAIAMGWLGQPQVMLLDEPSAGLAPLFVTEVFRTLRKLTDDGLTLVVVEQNARSILRWCDHAYILREGRMVFDGAADAILADEETVKGYLGVQRQAELFMNHPVV